MGNLSDQLDSEYAPAWKPSPGDKIEGVITGLSEREGSFGKYPIVTIRTAGDEELACHCYHAVLAAKLAELRPKVGERVALKYVGTVAKSAGGSYHSYRAAIDRPDATGIDWGQYADTDAPTVDRDDVQRPATVGGIDEDADADIPF